MADANSSILCAVSTQHSEAVKVNRRNLIHILEALKLLGRQNIPFRGHNKLDSSINKGNFESRRNTRATNALEIQNTLHRPIYTK